MGLIPMEFEHGVSQEASKQARTILVIKVAVVPFLRDETHTRMGAAVRLVLF